MWLNIFQSAEQLNITNNVIIKNKVNTQLIRHPKIYLKQTTKKPDISGLFKNMVSIIE
jgi:hypothetical protein